MVHRKSVAASLWSIATKEYTLGLLRVFENEWTSFSMTYAVYRAQLIEMMA